MRTRRGVGALAALVVAGMAPAALAQYHVSGGIGLLYDQTTTIGEGNYDRQGGVQQGGGVNFDQNGDVPSQTPSVHSQANSLGDVFGLHAHAYAQVIKPFQTYADTDPFPRRYGVTATANATGDYSVTVSNPGVAAGTPVQTSFTVHLHGETIQGAGNTPDTINASGANAGAQVSFSGIPGGGSFTRQVENGTADPQYGSGALVNFVNDQDVTTGQFTVMNDQPFKVSVFLQAYATALGDYRESFSAEANSDFGGTLTFATDRPVFDLPAGYTANSVDGGIVDNMFVAVPEPGCLAAGAVGVLVLVGRRARRS